MIKKNKQESKFRNFLFLTLEGALVCALVFFLVNISPASGGVGQNVNVRTYLEIGNVFPEILNVSIQENAASIILTANATRAISCLAVIRDWNNESDFNNVYAEFFHSSSFYGDSNDNNDHYTNVSCNISASFGSWREHTDDIYLAVANCTFSVSYYANPGTWNCSVRVNDTSNYADFGSDTSSITELLAIGVPDSINYGRVNATYVSDEQNMNISNFGNVPLNLSLKGYAVTDGDGWAMNCTVGSLKNISIYYEKFNLSYSNPGVLTLEDINELYSNLTSTAAIKKFDLSSRVNDVLDDAFNSTYWRIYVPRGVAGTCGGNIVVGATQAAGS